MATRNLTPTKTKKSKQPVLEVQVMFEPSRLAEDCLEKAYACLIPIGQRRPASLPQEKPSKIKAIPQKPAAGGEI